ncbi:MAG: hypothetical protein KGM24_10515 [Elusimicrobia bacterium]|nr:hypothetical protein [Elusimicrobiota bacterium]
MTPRPAAFPHPFHVPPSALAGFFALLTACALAARLLRPRLRRGVLAAAGLAYLAFFLSAAMAPAVAALALLLGRLCRGRDALTKERALAASALVLFGLLPACLGGVFLRTGARGPEPAALLAVVFLVNVLKKSVYYVYERRTGRVRGLEADELAAYLFALPFAVGSVIFAASEVDAGWEARPAAESVRSGLKTLASAALHAAACLALFRLRWARMYGDQFLTDARSYVWWRIWIVFVSSYVAFYLYRYAVDQTCVGAARLLGWDVRGNYDWALFPVDYADYWRRWNIHFRELLMALFYYPSALRLARRRPERREANLIAACFVTFAGAAVFNFVLRASFFRAPTWTPYRNLAVRVALYEGFAWVMVSAAGIAEMRRRARGAPERGLGRRVFGAAATLLLRSASLPLYETRDPRAPWTAPLSVLGRACGLSLRAGG